MWEYQCDNLCKIHNAPNSHSDSEHLGARVLVTLIMVGVVMLVHLIF